MSFRGFRIRDFAAFLEMLLQTINCHYFLEHRILLEKRNVNSRIITGIFSKKFAETSIKIFIQLLIRKLKNMIGRDIKLMVCISKTKREQHKIQSD